MEKEHFQLSTKVMHLRMVCNEGDIERVLQIRISIYKIIPII